jgi:hypothetical protein
VSKRAYFRSGQRRYPTALHCRTQQAFLGVAFGVNTAGKRIYGMSMLDVDSYWQMTVKGGILVLAVWIDVVSGSNQRSVRVFNGGLT